MKNSDPRSHKLHFKGSRSSTWLVATILERARHEPLRHRRKFCPTVRKVGGLCCQRSPFMLSIGQAFQCPAESPFSKALFRKCCWASLKRRAPPSGYGVPGPAQQPLTRKIPRILLLWLRVRPSPCPCGNYFAILRDTPRVCKAGQRSLFPAVDTAPRRSKGPWKLCTAISSFCRRVN